MKPTVSVSKTLLPSTSRALVVGDRVVKGWSWALTADPVRELRRVDLPALVYPARATRSNPCSLLLCLRFSPLSSLAASSALILAILPRIS